jgi:hypothetical protein
MAMSEAPTKIVTLLHEMRAENLAQHQQTRAMIIALQNKVAALEGRK